MRKGQIKNPIASYPDLDTKIRESKGKGRQWQEQEESDDQDNSNRRRSRRRGSKGRSSKGRRQGGDDDEDLRSKGPFNVDRAPTGKFVKKGSINNPIDEYSDVETKLKEGEKGSGGGRQGRQSRSR